MKFQIALIGQPNVGKSTLFSRLTGVGVISSNYPGTTVEFDEATVTYGGNELHFHDLPGTYSLSTTSSDEDVVIKMLRDADNDVIVVVADSTDLEPSLVLSMEVLELGLPTIIALNKYDLSMKRMTIDVEKLEKIFGVPVIPVSSRNGDGMSDLLDAISSGKAKVSDYRVMYDDHIVEAIDKVMETHHVNRGKAIKILEGIDDDSDPFIIGDIDREFTKIHGDHIGVHIARDRYGDAHVIVMETVHRSTKNLTRSEKISDITIEPSTGIPILIGILVLTFITLIGLGGIIAEWIDHLYTTFVGTALIDLGGNIAGDIGKALMSGIDSSIQAILGLVIPYIMVFYIILGILEDTGYLPRAVVLLDRLMHHFGLHGNAFIPIMVGFGCNVPAILATRMIRSKRERIILCSMICMAVPCSAQIAIMTGVTGKFAGIEWVLVILAILTVLMVSIGIVLNKTLKLEPSNLAIELPELQVPRVMNVINKMWMRSKDFFAIAVPLLIIGSIIVELCIYYNLLDVFVEPMSWLTVDMLGLPAVTIICFIVGVVRKEMSYGMLVIVGAITEMDPSQFVVYGIIMSIYMPCIATIAVMRDELGWKNTLAVCLSSVTIAVLVGTLVNQLFNIGFITA
ncbi:ferrous iron transport protein B [Candidatus Methanarcanum hacksteinii]|uniref:ferrous iron transport protein B n=1 Tax=Candidatus Methanarcanum hacksteinii TaxID=2911857 RepID=UPI0037DD2C29